MSVTTSFILLEATIAILKMGELSSELGLTKLTISRPSLTPSESALPQKKAQGVVPQDLVGQQVKAN
jgi:hypothetical protein